MRQAVLLTTAVVALSGCALKGDVRRVEAQLQELRAETARADSARAVELTRDLTRVLALLDAVQDTLSAQQRQLVILRGEFRSDLTDVLRQLVQVQEITGQSQQRLTELRAQLERRDRVRAAVATPDVPGTDTTAGGMPTGLPGPDELYDLSLSHLRRGSPRAARMGFQQLLQAYPTHGRAADALFFIGESWAGLEADSAAVAYEEVAQSFPNSSRAPSSLYKLGLLAERRGDVSGARVYYNRVIAGYPRSEEAALAREKLNPGR